MQNSLVLFDWSGVISNDFELVLKAVNCVLRQFGKSEISAQELRDTFSTDVKTFYATRGIAEFEKTQLLYKKFFAENGNPEVIPDAVDVVNGVMSNNIPVAIFSSHPSSLLEREARDYELNGSLKILGGVSKDTRKPNKHIEDFLIEIPHDRILYFGDTSVDINLANFYGLVSVAVSHKYSYHDENTLRKANPVYLIHSITEASGLVEKVLT